MTGNLAGAKRKLKLSDNLAVMAGKFSAVAIRAMRLGLGSNVPGRVARKLSPRMLSLLAAQSKNGVVAVTGTNGKSTTSGFVSAILDQAGLSIAHNRQGANMISGITATLVETASWSGRLNVDYCLFEIDEASLPLVAAETPISTIVVTNLFRDQLDRFGELDTTAKLIGKGIAIGNSRTVLNADDPNVSQLGSQGKRIFFGIESFAAKACAGDRVSAESTRNAQCADESERLGSVAGAENSPCTDSNASSESHASSNSNAGNIASAENVESAVSKVSGYKELSYCPACGAEYKYSRIFYGQIGHYFCQACGAKRPQPSVVACDVAIEPARSSFTLRLDAGGGSSASYPIHLSLPGLFNVYNALAAAALCHSLGIEGKVIQAGLSNYKTLFGRSESINIDGKEVIIQLIKNPAGATEVISSVIADPDARILVAINDNYADGRDVSWLWDAEFERFAEQAKNIFVSGIRAYDMAVRLKYAGLNTGLIVVEPDLSQALDKALQDMQSGERLYLMPTYTCLLELQKIMQARGLALSGTG